LKKGQFKAWEPPFGGTERGGEELSLNAQPKEGGGVLTGKRYKFGSEKRH